MTVQPGNANTVVIFGEGSYQADCQKVNPSGGLVTFRWGIYADGSYLDGGQADAPWRMTRTIYHPVDVSTPNVNISFGVSNNGDRAVRCTFTQL
jgi:hypothetical protein